MFSNTKILCFVIGWQGGTVHQVAEALGVSSKDIIDATEDRMEDLMRMAQAAKWHERHNLLTALGVALDHHKLEYHGHEYPVWLQEAIETHRLGRELTLEQVLNQYIVRKQPMAAHNVAIG